MDENGALQLPKKKTAMQTARADVGQLGNDTVYESHLWSDIKAVRDLFSPVKSHTDQLVRPHRG